MQMDHSHQAEQALKLPVENGSGKRLYTDKEFSPPGFKLSPRTNVLLLLNTAIEHDA